MPVRINKSVVISTIVISILVLCAVLAVMLAPLGRWLVAGEFGKVEITLRNGSKIYAIREARGLSSETLSFTRNPDGCISADPANDYVIMNPAYTSVLYSVTTEGLTLYDDASPGNSFVKVPTRPWTDIKININKLKNPSYDSVYADPERYGATLSQIPLNETCWRNLFRRGHRRQ